MFPRREAGFARTSPSIGYRTRAARGLRAIAVVVSFFALFGSTVIPSATGDQARASGSNLSAIVGGNAAFLQGTYIQVGVAKNGRFGTRSSGASAPAGFATNSGTDLGFRADRDRNGTFDDGDFFLPGGDFEGWALEAAGTSSQFDNGQNTTAGTLSDLVVSSSQARVTHTTTAQGLTVIQTYSVPILTPGATADGDQQLSVSVIVKNETANSVSDVYFSRAVDPDNNQTQGCGFSTTNTVQAQYGVSGSTYSLVSATQPDSCLTSGARTGSNQSYIGLFSSDPRSSVGVWKSSFGSVRAKSFVRDFSTSFIYTGSNVGDNGIGLSLNLGTLAAGAQTSFTYAYVLSGEAAAQAVASAAAPSVPAGTPAVGSVDLAWDQPTSADPIIGYRVRYTLDNGSSYTTFASDFQGDSAPRTMAITGLTDGLEYKFQVMALTGTATLTNGVYTAATEGSWSSSSLGVIPGAPSAPTIASVTAGNQKLTVAFTAPTATGGVPITAYEYSTDNGSTWTTASGTSSPIVITGLTNGTTYQVKLRGKNASHSGVASSATNGTPASSVPDAPTISSIATSSQTLTVAFTAPVDNGGASISRYEYSTDNGATWRRLSPDVTASPFVIDKVSSDGTTSLVNGVAYVVSIRAVNANGNSAGAAAVTATPGIPVVASSPAAPVVPPTVVQPPRLLPRVVPTPPPVVGPVLSGGTSTPPSAPTALIGGRPLPIQTQVTDPNTMSLRAGVLNIGMNIPADQGSVRQQGSSTEIQVRNGGVASVTGSGVLPRSTVQVFMPLQGSNAREIARIPVDATGSFSGDALFGATPSETPLPIGRHVLQMVTVDENRQQTVVELTVNIAQPPPAPELNRSTNERPALLPGQSIATNGGQPEAVVVTPIPDQKQATIQGDGWSMAVGVESENGGVTSGEGGAVVTFVRDQGAVVSGEGFMPGTRADVWLFSDPTLLGTVDIDENGEFNGTVNIDGNVVTVGEHTLQLQGVGEDGYVRAANLGVTVTDEAPTMTEQTSGSFLWWLWLLILLLVIAVLWFALWRYRRARS